MTKLFLIETNADIRVIALDYENSIARVLSSDEIQSWKTVSDLEKVEDVSSWNDGYDFSTIKKMIEDETEFKILATLETEL